MDNLFMVCDSSKRLRIVVGLDESSKACSDPEILKSERGTIRLTDYGKPGLTGDGTLHAYQSAAQIILTQATQALNNSIFKIEAIRSLDALQPS